jgi:hypothetical protein
MERGESDFFRKIERKKYLYFFKKKLNNRITNIHMR